MPKAIKKTMKIAMKDAAANSIVPPHLTTSTRTIRRTPTTTRTTIITTTPFDRQFSLPTNAVVAFDTQEGMEESKGFVCDPRHRSPGLGIRERQRGLESGCRFSWPTTRWNCFILISFFHEIHRLLYIRSRTWSSPVASPGSPLIWPLFISNP